MSEQYVPAYARWYPWDEVLEWKTGGLTLEENIQYETRQVWFGYGDFPRKRALELAYSIYWRENGVVCTILVRKDEVLHDHEAGDIAGT